MQFSDKEKLLIMNYRSAYTIIAFKYYVIYNDDLSNTIL